MSDAKLEVSGLRIRRGGRTLIESFDLSAGPGVVHVRGANGAGKSSLMRALAGVVPLVRGSVTICGKDLERDPVDAKARVGWLPDGADAFGDLTPDELLDTVQSMRRSSDDRDDLVAGLALGSPLSARMRHLSYGQRRKSLLAAALVGRPAVLLLDEPDDGLDAESLRFAHHYLAGRCDDAVILLASHQDPPLPVARTIDL